MLKIKRTATMKRIAQIVAELCAGLLSGLVVALGTIWLIPQWYIGPWGLLRTALTIGGITVLHLIANDTLTRWGNDSLVGSTWNRAKARTRSSGLSNSLVPASRISISSAQNSSRKDGLHSSGTKLLATKTCAICERVRESKAFEAVARAWQGMRQSTPPNLSRKNYPPASQPSDDGGVSGEIEVDWKLPSRFEKEHTGQMKQRNGRKVKSMNSSKQNSKRKPSLKRKETSGRIQDVPDITYQTTKTEKESPISSQKLEPS